MSVKHSPTPEAPSLGGLDARQIQRTLNAYVQACHVAAKQADQAQVKRARHEWRVQGHGAQRWGPEAWPKTWALVATLLSIVGLGLLAWSLNGGLALQRGQLGWVAVSVGLGLPLGIWSWVVHTHRHPHQHIVIRQQLMALRRLALSEDQGARAAEACQRLASALGSVHGAALRREALQCLGEFWIGQLGPIADEVCHAAEPNALQTLRRAAKAWAPMAVQHVLSPWWGTLSREEPAQILRLNWCAFVLAERNLCASVLPGLRANGADLYAASLQGANWSGAHLRCAQLNYGLLHLANFSGADLRDASLDGADASGAAFPNAQLSRVSATHLCAMSADFSNAQAQGIRLSHGKLQLSRWSHAQLSGADWSDVDARHVDLTGASLGAARLQRCDLRGAQLAGVKWDDGTDLRGVLLDRSTRWHLNSRDADPKRDQAYVQAWLAKGAVWLADESDPMGMFKRETTAFD